MSFLDGKFVIWPCRFCYRNPIITYADDQFYARCYGDECRGYEKAWVKLDEWNRVNSVDDRVYEEVERCHGCGEWPVLLDGLYRCTTCGSPSSWVSADSWNQFQESMNLPNDTEVVREVPLFPCQACLKPPITRWSAKGDSIECRCSKCDCRDGWVPVDLWQSLNNAHAKDLVEINKSIHALVAEVRRLSECKVDKPESHSVVGNNTVYHEAQFTLMWPKCFGANWVNTDNLENVLRGCVGKEITVVKNAY